MPGLPDGRRISSSDGQWPKDGHHRLFPQFNVYICACNRSPPCKRGVLFAAIRLETPAGPGRAGWSRCPSPGQLHDHSDQGREQPTQPPGQLHDQSDQGREQR